MNFIPRTYEEQISYEEDLARQNGRGVPSHSEEMTSWSSTTRITPLGALSRTAALERVASTKIEWRIEGVLSSVDYGTLAGSKGVGKSLALGDMAV